MAALGALILVLAVLGLILIPIGLSIWAFVFWLKSLLEILRAPAVTFRAAGADKTVWVLVVIFLGVLGALIYKLTIRDKIRWYLPGAGPASLPRW